MSDNYGDKSLEVFFDEEDEMTDEEVAEKKAAEKQENQSQVKLEEIKGALDDEDGFDTDYVEEDDFMDDEDDFDENEEAYQDAVVNKTLAQKAASEQKVTAECWPVESILRNGEFPAKSIAQQ